MSRPPRIQSSCPLPDEENRRRKYFGIENANEHG